MEEKKCVQVTADNTDRTMQVSLGCIIHICSVVNPVFTQSPIPINTYLDAVTTCSPSENTNAAWCLTEEDDIFCMLNKLT